MPFDSAARRWFRKGKSVDYTGSPALHVSP